MDTTKCTALLTILEKGSLSAAADALGYTPSGISRMIDSMEEETGFTILTRSRKGVALTPEGEDMLPLIRGVARAGELYEQSAHRILGLDVGHIHIGTAYFAFYPWLGELIAGFHEQYPAISVDIQEMPSARLAQALDSGALDMASMSRRDGSHEFRCIRKDPLLAILPPDHPYAKKKKLPAERFSEEPFIQLLPGHETDNAIYFRAHGIHPNIQFTSSDTMSGAAMVAAGLGITTSNGIIAEELGDNVVKVPVDPPTLIEIGMGWPLKESLSPAAERFTAYVLAHIDECPLRD